MNKILLIYYRRTLAYYTKCKYRLKRRMVKGTFVKLSVRKRQILLNRIARLQAKIDGLKCELKALTTSGIIIAGLCVPMEATGQNLHPYGHEFKVNSNTTGNDSFPKVAADADGDYVVVWQSDGENAEDQGIFARRYSFQGIPLGAEFKVNTSTAGSHKEPSIAINREGDFVVVWTIIIPIGFFGEEEQDVLARRFDENGQPVGNEFTVNSTSTGKQYAPDVTMDSEGNFVVAWSSDSHNEEVDIYMQRYDYEGEILGSEFRVNTFTTGTQTIPKLAMNNFGDFIITWSNNYGTDEQGIYAQRINSNGELQGNEFKIHSETYSGTSVAIGDNGNFVVTWFDDSSGPFEQFSVDIYARRYNAQGAEQGQQFLVNTYTTEWQSDPSIAMDEVGNFVIAWQSSGQDGNNNGIFARRYNAQGIALSDEFQVNTYTTGWQSYPSVAMDREGEIVIAWDGSGEGEIYGIYAQQYTYPGNNIRVNTTTAYNPYSPVTAMDKDGDYIIVWENSGQDGDYGGIYAQRYNAQGVAQGSEFRVNTYTTGSQTSPSVAMDEDGDFVVVWTSNGQDGDYGGIYAQRYNAQGVAQGSEFRVNTYTLGWQNESVVAMNEGGDFVIVWQSDGQDGNEGGIYAQRYNTQGIAQGKEFRMNTFTTGSQSSPSIAMDADGDFVVVWVSENGIYAQRYNTQGSVQGTEFKINTQTVAKPFSPVVAMDENGNFVVSWAADNGESEDIINTDIYAQRYSAAGITQGNWFRVNTSTLLDQSSPDVKMDVDGDFVIVWESDYNLAFQRYTSQGNAIGSEVFVKNDVTDQGAPSLGMSATGDFVITWSAFSLENYDDNIYSHLFKAPTDILISTSNLAENEPTGKIVGVLSTADNTGGDTHSYSLASGSGSTNNNVFELSGNHIKTKALFNFETKSIYSIRIRSTDIQGIFYEKIFTINITDVNDVPTNLSFNQTGILENVRSGAVLGSFSSVDEDTKDTYTYTLVNGTGDVDNGNFTIENNQLTTNTFIDYELKNTYSIRVQTDDGNGGTFQKGLVLPVINLNDTPTLNDIADLQIEENTLAISVSLSNITSGGESNQQLLVSASSDNDELIKDSDILIFYTSPIPTGNIRLKPADGKSGVATITVRVSDNGGTDNGAIDFIEKSFRVTVIASPKNPIAPVLLSAQASEANASSQINLVWSNVENETGYRIAVSEGDELKFNLLETTKAANDTTFLHTGLKADTRYFYKVLAYNVPGGNSLYSQVMGAVTALPLVTGQTNASEDLHIRLYPNPAKDKCYIEIPATSNLATKAHALTLYNTRGEVLWKDVIEKGQLGKLINITHLPSGIYTLAIKNEESMVTKQIIKN